MNWTYFASILMSVVGGWSLVSYRAFAEHAGYPIGLQLQKSWPIALGLVTALGALAAGWSYFGWGWMIVFGLAGFFLSFVLTTLTKNLTPLLSFGLIIVGYGLLFFTQLT